MPTRAAQALLEWYGAHRRELPWRRTGDAYAIWIAEVMLQQTRVETVVPFYRRWLERFPTVARLAGASEAEVLAAWEGLGYYTRALKLRRAAQVVVSEHGGRLPRTAETLRGLPGVGAYTAAAVAALAFGADAIALDGNLRRVIARLLDLDLDVRSPAGEGRLLAWGRRHLPAGRAGEFNQALMDLGALVCRPRRPRCEVCPLRRLCRARAHGTQHRRPVRSLRPDVPRRIATAGVVRRRGRVLIGRRPVGGLLGGLWEFPGGKCRASESTAACLRRELREELAVGVRVGASLGVFRHAYSHFRVTVHAFECELTSGRPQAREHTALRWVHPARLGEYPMGKVARRIAGAVARRGAR